MLRHFIVAGMLTIGLWFIGVRQVGAQLEFATAEILSPNINDDAQWEAGPSLSYDGLELFFSGGPGATLYSAERDSKEGDFGTRQRIRRPASHPSVSADGLSLYFQGAGGQDLWIMTRDTIEDEWGRAELLGPTVNSQYEDGAPGISADGLELYFTSDRPGEGSGSSIWVSKRETVESSWEEPVELGPHINTTSFDGGPDISADGLTLFFTSLYSSGGFGDFDIRVATRETIDSDWGEPVNLGPEINTSQSEISPHLSADGSEFYFSRGNNWSDVPSFDIWRVPVILPPPTDALQAGDADQNHSFDQLDLVRVMMQAGKYLTGEPATWGDGDWNGAPGGSAGNPPPGDGVFGQLDIIKALSTGLYMTGPHAAVRPKVDAGEADASISKDATIDEIWGDGLEGADLTSAPIDSAAAFTLGPAENSISGFEIGADSNITVVDSLAGGVDVRDVDLAYVPVPEPASVFLLSLGALTVACSLRRVRGS